MALTTLHFEIDVPKDRAEALDRRDEITAALDRLGIRVSLTTGPYVHLVDDGLPTLAEILTDQT